MTEEASNVRVGVTGAVWKAPLGTPLPTDTEVALDAAFEELGGLSPDGIGSTMPTSSNKIRFWQNGATAREVQTEFDLVYTLVCRETNPVVLEAYFGNYDSGVVEINAVQPDKCIYVIDIIDGDDLIREVLPYAQVTERGERKIVGSEAIDYPLTITAYPDPDYSGDQVAPANAYQYILDISGGIS